MYGDGHPDVVAALHELEQVNMRAPAILAHRPGPASPHRSDERREQRAAEQLGLPLMSS